VLFPRVISRNVWRTFFELDVAGTVFEDQGAPLPRALPRKRSVDQCFRKNNCIAFGEPRLDDTFWRISPEGIRKRIIALVATRNHAEATGAGVYITQGNGNHDEATVDSVVPELEVFALNMRRVPAMKRLAD